MSFFKKKFFPPTAVLDSPSVSFSLLARGFFKENSQQAGYSLKREPANLRKCHSSSESLGLLQNYAHEKILEVKHNEGWPLLLTLKWECNEESDSFL